MGGSQLGSFPRLLGTLLPLRALAADQLCQPKHLPQGGNVVCLHSTPPPCLAGPRRIQLPRDETPEQIHTKQSLGLGAAS